MVKNENGAAALAGTSSVSSHSCKETANALLFSDTIAGHMKMRKAKDVYTLADLRDWPTVTAEVSPPIRLGVLGDPVAHSLSPAMQNAALEHSHLRMQYGRFQIRPNELKKALELARTLEFVGLNLTVPHKVAAFTLVDELEAETKEIGAVNTITVRTGRLLGSNTDGIGFARAVRSEFSVDLHDLRILVLGAGGAARAIAVQCARANCERLVIVNRDLEKAKELVAQLQPALAGPRVLGPVARLEAVPWEERSLKFQIDHTDLVVNATPLGLNPHDPPVLPATLLQPHLMVYDVVYSRQQRTPLVSAAREAGARAADGLSMLLHPGARAFEIWFEQEAPLDIMRNALL
jgi:shikimate dehydrogenase